MKKIILSLALIAIIIISGCINTPVEKKIEKTCYFAGAFGENTSSYDRCINEVDSMLQYCNRSHITHDMYGIIFEFDVEKKDKICNIDANFTITDKGEELVGRYDDKSKEYTKAIYGNTKLNCKIPIDRMQKTHNGIEKILSNAFDDEWKNYCTGTYDDVLNRYDEKMKKEIAQIESQINENTVVIEDIKTSLVDKEKHVEDVNVKIKSNIEAPMQYLIEEPEKMNISILPAMTENWINIKGVDVSNAKNVKICYWFIDNSNKRCVEREIERNEVKNMSKNPIVVFETDKGTFETEIFLNEAPITAKNFLELVDSKFYDDLTFHRVEPGFVTQGGDPKGDGTGGSNKTIPLEIIPKLKHELGSMGMARTTDPNSATSQFYFVTGNASFLDGQYAVFGKVLGDGMDIVLKLKKGDKMNKVYEKK